MNLEKILQQNIYHVMSKYIDISNQYENVLADTVKLTGQKTDPQSHLQRFDNILPRLAVAVLVNRPSLKIVDLTLLVGRKGGPQVYLCVLSDHIAGVVRVLLKEVELSMFQEVLAVSVCSRCQSDIGTKVVQKN